MTAELNLGEIPFFWRTSPVPGENGGLPLSLPFTATFDENYGLIRQKFSSKVALELDSAYKLGSEIAGLMDAEGIGRIYADDFLKFVLQHADHLKNTKALEIGSGTGFFLKLLKENGFKNLVGVEPSESLSQKHKSQDIQIFNGFFPVSNVDQASDLIISYGVLEHIYDLKDFLKSIHSNLQSNGLFIGSVPNCKSYISNGDISMFFHEHWNYFDTKSLSSLLSSFNFEIVDFYHSSAAGALYFVCRKSKGVQKTKPDLEEFEHFKRKARRALQSFEKYFRIVIGNKKKLGVYVPARAMNYLSSLGYRDFLLFDDNHTILNTYYPGLNTPVLARQSLIQNPPEELLIMSSTFGLKIKNEIQSSIPNTTIWLLDEIIEQKFLKGPVI